MGYFIEFLPIVANLSSIIGILLLFFTGKQEEMK